MGKRVGLFSYGSGLASSIFSLKVVRPIDHIVEKLNLKARLESRSAVDPKDFEEVRIFILC
jgi:hydroxymethylglutaryl-CoA synthase